MKLFKVLLSLSMGLLLAGASYAHAQMSPNTDVPLNPKVIKGQLDNGLTYYVQHNETTTDRAEFYLVNNVGAIQESDKQDGLAHFCEHMAFNGTKHFPGKGVLDFMERNGVKFGHNVNAFTSIDLTTYMLSGVPVDKEGLIDSSLLVLKDWAQNVTFDNNEIDKERKVIHEEWRTRRNARFRMSDKHDKVLWKGSKYAKRNVIGKLDVIDNCEYETLKSFYEDWYRPGLQAVIVVGDIDSEKVAGRIKTMFADVPEKENPRERKNYPVPDHKDVRVSIARDEEASNVSYRIYFKQDAVVPGNKNINYMKNQIKQRLVTTMLRDRLNEIRQQENPPFNRAYGYYGNIVRNKAAFVGMVSANTDDPARGLKVYLDELFRMDKYGFTESEFRRAKKQVLRRYEKQYKEKDKRESRSIIWSYMYNYLRNEPAPGPEFKYELAQEILPETKPGEINELAKSFITDDNIVVTLSAPSDKDIDLPGESKIKGMLKEARSSKLQAYNDDALDIPLMEDAPEAGEIVEDVGMQDMNFYEWELSNGARIIVKPTEFKDDEIQFSAISEGGSSLYTAAENPSVDYASSLVRYSGLGKFSKTQLDKKLSDKMIYLSPYISTYSEGLRGTSSTEDVETFLQMIHMYFTNIREDKSAYNSFIQRRRTRLERKYANPRAVAMDSFNIAYHNHHPYYKPMTAERLSEIDYDRAMQAFRERFKNAADFSFIFVGNINVDTLKEMVSRYIGSLPGDPAQKEEYKDLDVNYPQGHAQKHFKHEMKIPKSTVSIIYHGQMEYSTGKSVKMDILNHVLDLRYTESIREEMGGSYGVSVFGGLSRTPKERASIMIFFDCDPTRVSEFVKEIHQQYDMIATDGPKPEDVQKAKQHLLKNHQEKLEKNRAWKNMLQKYVRYGEKPVIRDAYTEIVKSMKAEDIQKLAKDLKKDNQIFEMVMNPISTE